MSITILLQNLKLLGYLSQIILSPEMATEEELHVRAHFCSKTEIGYLHPFVNKLRELHSAPLFPNQIPIQTPKAGAGLDCMNTFTENK